MSPNGCTENYYLFIFFQHCSKIYSGMTKVIKIQFVNSVILQVVIYKKTIEILKLPDHVQ